MALIKCPECGNQVSSNAAQCIHCGCKFTACPECGSVFVGKADVCPQCGYGFQKKKTLYQESVEPSSELEADLFSAWENNSSKNRLILKILKVGKIIVSILCGLFIVIAVILLLQWQDGNSLSQLGSLAKTRNAIKSLVIVDCIIFVLDCVGEYVVNAFIKIKCSRWLVAKKIDACDELRSRSHEILSGKGIDKYQTLSEAAYLAQNGSGKAAIYVGAAIRIVCAIAASICVGFCCIQNFDEAMSATLFERDFEFQYIALIAFGVIAVIALVATIMSDSAFEKKYNSWFAQNISGNTEETK